MIKVTDTIRYERKVSPTLTASASSSVLNDRLVSDTRPQLLYSTVSSQKAPFDSSYRFGVSIIRVIVQSIRFIILLAFRIHNQSR
jgi:hypothetical protein